MVEAPIEKPWVYLYFKNCKGDEIDLGKVYLCESIESIIKNIKKRLGFKKFGCIFLLSKDGKPVRHGDLKDFVKQEEIFNEVTFNGVLRLTGGGPEVIFIDSEKGELAYPEFGEGPKYREVIRGINFFGECKSPGCEAEGSYVYMKFGMGTFDYIKLAKDGKFVCPMCKNIVIVESCGFWDCNYQIECKGAKIGTSEVKSFSRAGVAGKMNFVRLEPVTDFGDIVTYSELKYIVSKNEAE